MKKTWSQVSEEGEVEVEELVTDLAEMGQIPNEKWDPTTTTTRD